jgi:hypothetical protein
MPAVLQRKSSSSLAEFPELARLSKARRLKLADELWMSGIGDETPVPQWHQETMDQTPSHPVPAPRPGSARPAPLNSNFLAETR